MAELPKSAVSRLAKNAGIERIGEDAVESLVAKTEEYVSSIAKKAKALADHAGRKTVKADDVEMAVKPA